MHLFRAIGFALRYLPLLILAINTVEALRDSGSGAEKRAIVVAAMRQLLGKLGVDLDQHRLDLLDDAVDMLVTIFNLTGGFIAIAGSEHAPAAVEAVKDAEARARAESDERIRILEDELSET